MKSRQQVGESDTRARRVRGVVVDAPKAWAAANGAAFVDFGATRGESTTLRAWLETVAAFDGASLREARAQVSAWLERAGLVAVAHRPLSWLSPSQRAIVAIVEEAISNDARAIVVPAPPLASAARDEVRRAALSLLAGRDLILHAHAAAELLPFLAASAIVDEEGHPIVATQGGCALAMRVVGTLDAHATWKAALAEQGASIVGGPIGQVVVAPASLSPAKVLAAAYEAGLDVLEMTPIGS